MPTDHDMDSELLVHTCTYIHTSTRTNEAHDVHPIDADAAWPPAERSHSRLGDGALVRGPRARRSAVLVCASIRQRYRLPRRVRR